MAFPMHVQDPTETDRLPLSQKSQPMNPQTHMGQFPFFSFGWGQWHYRLTGLCLPKRLFTLRWKVRVNRLECGDRAGKTRTSTDPGFKIQITKKAEKHPSRKVSSERQRENSWAKLRRVPTPHHPVFHNFERRNTF